MKQGAGHHRGNVAQSNLGPIIPALNPDVCRVITSFLPAYRWFGKTKLQLVSAAWNKELSSAKYHANKTSKSHYASCKTKEDALFILSDEKLIEQFTLGEIINMAALHEDIARETNSPALNRELNYELRLQLAVRLSKKNLNLAEDIFNRTKCNIELFQDYLVKLGLYHEKIAAQFMDLQVSLYPKINISLLVKLGRKYPSLAMKLLTTKLIRLKLNGMNIAMLGEENEEIAKFILTESELWSKLEGADLVILARKHKAIASKILNTLALREKLTENDLFNLSLHQVDIGISLFEKGEFSENSVFPCLLVFCEKNEAFAERILNDETLVAQITDRYIFANIAKGRERLAIRILDNLPACCEAALVAPVWLALFISQNVTIARRMLETKSICDRLNGHALAQIGSVDSALAMHILTTQKLLEKLNGEDLSILGEKHADIAEYILQDPMLSAKLAGRDIKKISASLSNESIIRIFNTPALLAKLDDISLAFMCMGQRRMTIAKYVLSTPLLYEKLNKMISLMAHMRMQRLSDLREMKKLHIGLVLHILQSPDLLSKFDNKKDKQIMEHAVNITMSIHRIAKDVKNGLVSSQSSSQDVKEACKRLSDIHLTPPRRAM